MLKVPPLVSHTWDALFPLPHPKSSQTRKSLEDPPISCFSQVWRKIWWSNMSSEVLMKTSVLTYKKDYMDILMFVGIFYYFYFIFFLTELPQNLNIIHWFWLHYREYIDKLCTLPLQDLLFSSLFFFFNIGGPYIC